MSVHELFTRDELRDKFGWEEYFVFALMLLISALIGVYFWWKGQRTNAEFLMGGRSMGTIPMTLSLVASFMSAITLLGTPAEMYVFGTQYCLLVLSYPFVMAGTIYFYLPVLYNLGVSTSYEYLEWRFNKAVRVLASACFTLQMTLYMAIVVYTPALALAQITGLGVDEACAIIFVVCIFYTAIGGIKAVMWTDTFQSIVMFGSFLAVIIKGNYDAGGAHVVFDENYKTGRIELFNFNPDMTVRHTVWSMIIGGYFTWISIYGINQTQVQRYLTVPKMEMAVKAIWWQILGIGSLLLMCAYAGLVIFAYYNTDQCDPIGIKLVDKKDQLFPLFVMQVMGDIPCIPGLFVAGVFSGALSTVSSGLNSLAAVTLQDFIQGACKVQLSERTSIITTKCLAVGYGILSYLVVFLVKYLPGVLEAALGIFGIVGGPVLGGFTLGMFFPWANSVGAFVGMFTSLIFTMWVGFGQTVAKNFGTYSVTGKPTTIDGCPADWIQNLTDSTTTPAPVSDESEGGVSFTHLPLYEISYMWFSAIACMFCLVVGLLVSLVTKPQDPKTLNPNLISPGLKGLFSFWPKPVRDFIDDLKIGSLYVSGERENRLRREQIIQTPHDPSKNAHYNPAYAMTETNGISNGTNGSAPT